MGAVRPQSKKVHPVKEQFTVQCLCKLRDVDLFKGLIGIRRNDRQISRLNRGIKIPNEFESYGLETRDFFALRLHPFFKCFFHGRFRDIKFADPVVDH